MKALFGRKAKRLVCVVAIVWASSGTAQAASVLLGSDYLVTMPGTFFDFGFGQIPFEGNPIGPAATDTIVQRQADAILPSVGSFDIIPTELVALSLQSVNPVTLGPNTGTLFVTLTPGTNSTGQMRIVHNFPDNGTPAPEGFFDSFFDVFFDLHLDGNFVMSGQALLCQGLASALNPNCAGFETGRGLWSHEPDPAALLVTGPAGDQQANNHTGKPPGFDDFHIVGGATERKVPPPFGEHRVAPACAGGPGGPGCTSEGAVPEPGILLLVGPALAGLMLRRRRLGPHKD
jgi:hypothetical protein